MIYENVELTGSLQVTGSIIVPMGGDSGRTNITGSLFFNTQSNALEIFTGESGSDWVDVFGSSSSGGGGGGAVNTEVEYLVIAGGGGGGSYGGGGAGGYLSGSITATSGSSYTITIGAGGAGSGNNYNDPGNAGATSSLAGLDITTVEATGGGHGGDNTGGSAAERGGDGGSGGGGSDGTSTPGSNAGGSGTLGQGNDGGDGAFSDPSYSGGGGGGAGTAGSNASAAVAGAGGNGLASSITGTSITRAGGGGGVTYRSSDTQASGGTGGGGEGGTWSGNTTTLTSATAGTTNTGGGGGSGQAGGSGVVILAYDSGSAQGAGGISGDAGNSRRYHQFNSSDTFIMGAVGDFDIVTGSNLVLHVDAGNFESRSGSNWIADLSGNSNHLSIQGGGSLPSNFWWEGDGTNALADFERNGAGPQSTVAHTGYGNFTGRTNVGWCIEFWIRSTATGGNSLTGRTIIGRNNGDTYGAISIFSNKLAWIRYNSSWSQEQSTTSINDGSWHHCVLNNHSDETIDIWVDGTKENDGATSTINPDTRYFKMDSLGRGYNGVNTDMDIGQLRVYDITLTDAQITQNYNATKTNFV